MLPSVLLMAGLLLGPVCCGATPTAAATDRVGSSLLQQATATTTEMADGATPTAPALAVSAGSSLPQQATGTTTEPTTPTAAIPTDSAESSLSHQAAETITETTDAKPTVAAPTDSAESSIPQQAAGTTNETAGATPRSPAPTAATDNAGSSLPQQPAASTETAGDATPTSQTANAATNSAESSLPQQAAATTTKTANTSLSMAEPQASVALYQVMDGLSELYRIMARAATAEPLAALTKTLADIQASVAIMSRRLDLLHESQTQQQEVQADLAERLDTIDQYVSARFDAVEASQDGLSRRVGELLQQHRREADEAGQATDLQKHLDAIEAAISDIPKTVLGRACHSDSDCSRKLSEAACGSDGRCSCRDGYRQVSNTECRKHSRLSEVCLEDADCQALTSHASCVRSVCSCAEGFWNRNNAECRPASAVRKGGSCISDQDCVSGLHLRCLSGTCSCPTKTIGDYDYRLTGGHFCSEGNVELRTAEGFWSSAGYWGLVCDDNWDTSDARVVCRSLGFSAGRPTNESQYGRGTNFYMDEVNCSGSESHLMRCSYGGWKSHDCRAGEVAGVRCS